MTDSITRLGELLTGRMRQTAAASAIIPLELGCIDANLSLSIDSVEAPVPKGDYMISLFLSAKTYRTSKETHTHNGGEHGGHDGGTGTHTHKDGEHDHRLPEDFRPLMAGDRVIVAWCGNEPVVLSIVVGS